MFEGWYTDLVDVYRMTSSVINGVTRQSRLKVAEKIPCRVYTTAITGPAFQNTAARSMSQDKLSCALGTDIRQGDELIVTRGASVGGATEKRYIAGTLQSYYDPVGGSLTSLTHLQVGLLDENIME